MSMESVEKVNCPNCNKESEFTVWKSVNVDIDPQMREKVKDGSIFDFECPHCGKKDHFVYPFLYHDMTNKFMCYFCSISDLVETENSLEELRKNELYKLTDGAIRMRIETEYIRFLEKLNIFENGYDDRVIEILKLLIIDKVNEQNPEVKATNALFDIIEKDGKKVPLLALINDEGEQTYCVDLTPEQPLMERLTEELKEYIDDSPHVNEEWARVYLSRKINNREKKAFLIRWNIRESVYHTYLDDLKKLKKGPVVITIEADKDAEIEQEDMALILMKNPSGLAAVGRFASPVYEAELTNGKHIHVVDVYLDILFSRLESNYFETHYFIGKYFKSIKAEGAATELLKKEEIEAFTQDLACMLLALEKPTTKISFNKNQNFRQLLCNYVSDFCPTLKQIVCRINSVNPEGHMLTYNPYRIKDLPKYCCEIDKLQGLLVPDGVKPYIPETPEFFELELGNMTLKFDNAFKKNTDGTYKLETSNAECSIEFNDVCDSPVLHVQVNEDKITMNGNNEDFYFLSLNENLMIKDFQKEANENQGLVEVKLGSTKAKKPFAYRIMKEMQEPCGVIYKLILQVHNMDYIANFAGTFKETGMTGVRDTFVFAALHTSGVLIENEDGVPQNWFEDRYDKTFTKGALMNRSEYECYDDIFPNHPLSVCRRFIKAFIENN